MNKCFLSIIIGVFLFSCSGKTVREKRIMTTIDPQRYFAEQLVDTFFTVEALVPAGTNPETYDLNPNQMVRLSVSTAYFYIGGLGFETAWIDKLKANNPQVDFFDNRKNISPINDDTDENNSHHHHHEAGDPHIWASPKTALTIAENMYDALAEIDPANEKIYALNFQKLSKKIKETDKIIAELLKNSSQKAFIIFHPSLTYFARDYGLTQYCIETDGKEPSPEHLKRLVKTAREQQIRTVFIQQEFDRKNAEIIAKEAECKLVVINPLSYHWDEEMIHIAKALSDE
jgi:zinc transport system substrate-binding protein